MARRNPHAPISSAFSRSRPEAINCRWLPLALTVVLGLAACGGGDPVGRIDAEEQVATIDGFGLQSAGPSNYDGRASILLEFSVPLASAQKFDELLVIRDDAGAVPSGSWVLENDGTALRFPYLESNRNYTVTLKADLAATDGTTLGTASDRTVHTGPLQPVLGFASQGTVLPAHESRGLPVVTVNTGEVDVEFLRVRDRDLGMFLRNFSGGGRRGTWSLEQMAGYADPVFSSRFAIDSVPNERTLSYLPIRDIDELSAPGLYFAVMKKAGGFPYEQDTALFFVSDIGLHVRHYPQSLLVHAASLESGEPKSGVLVVVRDGRGKLLARGETDGDGLVTLDGYSLKSDHLLLAQDGNDIALLPFNQPALDLSEFAVSGRPQRPVEIFPWASRDLYRPGETINVAALLRDHDGRPLPPQPVFATLRQPDGRAVFQQKLEPVELGFVQFTRTIAADAATGRWSVDFSVDPENSDRAHGFPFRVEEFLPERLKLDLKTAKERLAPGEPLELDVDADYLHGAPAAGNRFTARLALAAEPHPVEALKDFWFGDARAALPQSPDDVIDAKLDAEGRLRQALPVPLGEAVSTTVKVVVAGSVFETGGRAVSRSLIRTLWPAQQLVGVRPLFDMKEGASPDGTAEFEVIRTDATGELLAADQLAVKVIREVRDYQWRHVDNTGWTFDYTTRDETAHEETLSIAAGQRGRVAVPVAWGGYRIEITDPSTSLTLRQPFEAGWSSDSERGAEARPDKVKVVLDKPAYADGDTVTATLTPPHDGPALVLLEGEGLLWQKSVDARNGTTVEIPLDPAWNRHDLYLTALVFRPGSSADRISPNRAVGVAHVPLDRSTRTAKVTLTAPEKSGPNEVLGVEVQAPELAGKTARVRLSATDAGVLNITSYAVPDAAGWFFAPRRFGIEARDVYGRVIESYEGGQARLRYGGDMDLSALSAGRRPNAEVRIVDLLEAPVALDAEGKARVEVQVPDFNGTLRMRAVVFGEDRFGSAESDTVVRAPVLLEASLPRLLAPGDQGQLTLDIDNASGAAASLEVSLQASGPVKVGEASQSITLEDGARRTLAVPVTAKNGYGTASIAVELTGNGIHLTRSFPVVVRPAWPRVNRLKTVSVKAGASIAPDVSLRQGLYPESVVQRLSVGRLPPLPYAQSAEALLMYPYGCAEQTTSKAMPLVLLDDATRTKLGFNDAGFKDEQGRPLDLSLAARSRQLEAAFSRLASMQGENGHFSMWPGEFYPDTRITPWVTELMLTAKAAGLEVPQAMLDKALNVLLEDLLKGGNTRYEYEHYEHLRLAEMAHAAYVLARAGKAPLGTLRALYDNERSRFLVPLPLVHLGLALSIAGDRQRGAAAIDEAWTREWQRPDWLGDYGSELRDQVLMAALVQENGLATDASNRAGFDAVRLLRGEQGGSDAGGGRGAGEAQWLSTQEQIAILRLGRSMLASQDRVFDLVIHDGAAPETVKGTGFHTLTVGDVVAGVRVETAGEGELTVMHEVAGVPSTRPVETRDDMAIERAWYRPDGSPWKGQALREGEVLIVKLTAKAARRLADALIVDLAPGGLEVENLNLTDPEQWSGILVDDMPLSDVIGSGWARFEEYRDDRYVAAVDISEGSDSVRYYLLRAVTPGRYVIPPPVLEDMYRPKLRVIGTVAQPEVVVTPP